MPENFELIILLDNTCKYNIWQSKWHIFAPMRDYIMCLCNIYVRLFKMTIS